LRAIPLNLYTTQGFSVAKVRRALTRIQKIVHGELVRRELAWRKLSSRMGSAANSFVVRSRKLRKRRSSAAKDRMRKPCNI